MNHITLIGIDLAKNIFQLCGLNCILFPSKPLSNTTTNDYQLLLRIRTRHKQQRTGTVNQVRGILTE
ncbi:MAG: hypothetical protein GKR96_13210 [Gammaproteobacteria bacterium]|nr:hypothetical protein [Gammaproteobacteria bacterium]